MTISNFNGTSAKFFKVGDITIFSGTTPFSYEDLGKDGDIFISETGERYSKVSGQWQMSMAEWSGTDLPDDTIGQSGDLYRLLSSEGLSGSKYIKLDDSTVDPVGVKWLPITKELYSSKPNNDLFNNLDYYQADDGNYVKIENVWVKSESQLSGDSLPETRIGVNGDIYYCTSNSKYYYKADGVWEEIVAKYETSDTPDQTYGINNDIWLGATNFDVYVRENNTWVNKTNDKTFGANGLLVDDVFPNKTIYNSLLRQYKVKLNNTWQDVSKVYHSESTPYFYTGANGDIAINNDSTLCWVKDGDTWFTGTFFRENNYGVKYEDTTQYYIINDDEINEATIKTSSDVPTSTDGNVGDIYTIGMNTYYKDSSDNWGLIYGRYTMQSTPISCDNDNLNYYQYQVGDKNYVCVNRDWIQSTTTVTSETAPYGFSAPENTVYVTSNDLYYVYKAGWISASMYDSDTVPDEYCGEENDIYVMGAVKYAKVNNEWVDISSGTELSGNSDPDANIGNIYDTYINTSSNVKFIKTSIDTWNPIAHEYSNTSTTPPLTFWSTNSLYTNSNNDIYVKNDDAWVAIASIFYAANSLPPLTFWADYTIYNFNDVNYIKYNNSWNQILGIISSTDVPNDYMWRKGTLYNNGSHDYIKISNNEWEQVVNVFDSQSVPDSTYWGTNVIYETSTRKYINTSGIWENIIYDISAYDIPSDEVGQDGMVFITSNMSYYLKVNGSWKNIPAVLDKNTAPRYNSYGEDNSIYLLDNGCGFVKKDGKWSFAYDIISGSAIPFDDVGVPGTLFYLTTEAKMYVLYSDYSWKELGNTYNTTDNPLDTDGAYLWLYIKSDNDIVFKNESTWVQVSDIIKSNNLPSESDGDVNNLWIMLSAGLYLKDNGAWSKILTAGSQELNVRQEIYLFT